RGSAIWQPLMASSLLVLSFAAWSATETSRGQVVLWSGDDQWIRLEPQDSGAAPNDHPAQLNAEAVSNALSALRVRVIDDDSGTETQRPVFTRAEITNLAPQVVVGLGKAGPQQDVTFSTIGSHALSAGGLVKDPGVNAGRIFYQDGKLNVIFGELQSNYRKKNYYGQRGEDFTPRRQGTRSKASKQKFTLATSPGIELHATGGGVRNDWVLIDPAVAGAQLAATPESESSAPRQAAAAPAAAQPSPAPPPSTTTASPATSAAPAAAAGAAAAPAAATSSPAPATATPSADIEQRLQRLRDLKDKGLISEEAYNSKVKELLSEL
ncbi:MAG TPA: SHOCT domain-containing protein, partial [Longimicrobiales bacterium]|nr:SHOCT domain-containing protein [Longimicrobiales bacterium]